MPGRRLAYSQASSVLSLPVLSSTTFTLAPAIGSPLMSTTRPSMGRSSRASRSGPRSASTRDCTSATDRPCCCTARSLPRAQSQLFQMTVTGPRRRRVHRQLRRWTPTAKAERYRPFDGIRAGTSKTEIFRRQWLWPTVGHQADCPDWSTSTRDEFSRLRSADPWHRLPGRA